MPIPSIIDVKTILEPIESILLRIIYGAWSDYRRHQANHENGCRPITHPSARATVVWDWMVARAKEEFASRTDVRPIERDNSIWFVASNQVAFRFKKADDAGLSSNYPTQSALLVHDHGQELHFAGIPDIMRVEVVYVLDEPYQTEINDVRVVCRDGDQIAWWYRIKTVGQVMALPQAPAPQHTGEELVGPRGGRKTVADPKKDAEEK